MTYSNYEVIPDEILIKIFSYITNDNLNDIFNSLLVSKRWNRLATFALYNSLHFHTIKQISNFFKGLLTNTEDENVNAKRDKYLDVGLLEHEFNLSKDANKQIDDTIEVDVINDDIYNDIDGIDNIQNNKIVIYDSPIPMKYINSVKKINFGLSPNESQNTNDDGSFDNNIEWRQHCINSSLNLISIYCPTIVSLNLSGCQFYDYVFCELLENCNSLMYLDVSYSSIKQMGLLSILDAVSRTKNPLPLREINLSGIFRFWRLYREARFLPNLIKKAKDLKKVIILNCPDILNEIIEEFKTIKDNVSIIYETTTPINEMYMKKECSSMFKSSSNLTLAPNNEIYA